MSEMTNILSVTSNGDRRVALGIHVDVGEGRYSFFVEMRKGGMRREMDFGVDGERAIGEYGDLSKKVSERPVFKRGYQIGQRVFIDYRDGRGGQLAIVDREEHGHWFAKHPGHDRLLVDLTMLDESKIANATKVIVEGRKALVS